MSRSRNVSTPTAATSVSRPVNLAINWWMVCVKVSRQGRMYRSRNVSTPMVATSVSRRANRAINWLMVYVKVSNQGHMSRLYIDECTEDSHRCTVNQTCINSSGSYKCVQTCQPGYQLVDGVCQGQ